MVTSSTELTVDARPEPITIDPAHTAVIVVDMQNDFASTGGMFDRAGIDISAIQEIVAPTLRVLEAAREGGISVVYLKMCFRPDLSDFGTPSAPNWRKHLPLGVGSSVSAPDGSEGAILIDNTWNTEIIPQLAPQSGDTVVSKHRFSGFFDTNLDAILRGRTITSLIFTGATTSVCVESTLRDAMFRDYSCLLLEDCTAEPIGAGLSRSNHEASLLVTEALFGWVSDSSRLLAALDSNRP